MTIQSARTLLGLLRLIEAHQGSIRGRLRIQKEAYLLGSSGSDAFSTQLFNYHHYGPYSRQLSDILRDSVTSGLIKEELEQFQNVERYSYQLTDDGRSWLAEEGQDPMVEIADLVPTLTQPHWRALELAATARFLTDRGLLGEGEVPLDKAIELKPACTDFRDDATRILEALPN